jgi:cobalamin biosynthesis protein CobT
VLFVLSDGLPLTGEPKIQIARQQEHLVKVVKEMTAIGVEVVGVGICDDSVRTYYPHAVVVNRADDLPKVVMSEMEFLLLAQRAARR